MTISEGQNIVDICLQAYGSLDALVGLCDTNRLTLDVVLSGNVELRMENGEINVPVVSYFAARGKRINTGEKPLIDAPFRVYDNGNRIIDSGELRIYG